MPWHHADDFDRPIVEPNGLANEAWICSEAIAPRVVAENDDGRCAGFGVGLLDDAPKLGLDPQGPHHATRNGQAGVVLRLA
jgi:hypothetical protein